MAVSVSNFKEMARRPKPVQIRAVDSLQGEPEVVVRLVNKEIDEFEDIEAPVRLGSTTEASGSKTRLKLQIRDDLETRSHEPNIDDLVEPDPPAPELVENNWGETAKVSKPIPWGWFALLGIIMTSAIVWSLAKVEKSSVTTEEIRKKSRAIIVAEEQAQQNATRLIENMDALARKFYSASSVRELLPLVRHPDRVKPLMEKYYADKSVSEFRLRSIRSMTPLAIDLQGDFWVTTVIQSDDSVKNIVMQANESGEVLIDWESFVCYQPMAWDDYAKNRPAGNSMDFRVDVKQDSFFSHEFADTSQWVCFQLNALNSQEFLYGYVKSNDPLAAEIVESINRNGGEKASLILRLFIPEDLKSKRGVVIEKIVGGHWIYIDPPKSES